MEIGFSNEKYINEQTDFILKRVSRFQLPIATIRYASSRKVNPLIPI